MRRVYLAVAVMFVSVLAFVGINPAPAQAANTQKCSRVISSSGLNEADICIQVGYEVVNSTTKTLKYVNVTCSPAGNFSGGIALDGTELNVRANAGNIIWSASDANADVSQDTCNRTWAIGGNYKVQYFTGFYAAKARFYRATDQDFSLRVYAPN